MTSRLRGRSARVGGVDGWLTALCLSLLLAGSAAALWVGLRAAAAVHHLETASRLVEAAVGAGVEDALFTSETLSAISRETSAATSLTSDPIWAAATSIPSIGVQLEAVTTATEGIDLIASSALPELARALDDVGGPRVFLPRDGVVAVDAIADLAPSAARAALVGARGADLVREAEALPTVGVLDRALGTASGLATEVEGILDVIRRTTHALPGMLGSEQPRRLLLLFQNNSEWRSLGGIPGAVALLETDQGRLRISHQDTAGGLTVSSEPVATLTPGEKNVVGDLPTRYAQDITQLSRFPSAARIASAYWERKYGESVDGVIAIDPHVLASVLAVIGPVELPSGDSISGENAVDLFLNGVYERYPDPADQDDFFATTVRAIFEAIIVRPVDPLAFLDAVSSGVQQRRLFVWSAWDEERAMLRGTVVEGDLPPTDDVTTGIGVYLNDATGSKMDYYMRVETVAEWCPSGAGVRVALRNDAPLDAATVLPRYVTGGGEHGTPAGQVRTIVYVYLPSTSTVEASLATSGTTVLTTDDNRPVLVWDTSLTPGAETYLDLRLAVEHTYQLSVWTTPASSFTTDSPRGGCSLSG